MSSPARKAAELAAKTILATPGGTHSAAIQRRAVAEAAALWGDTPGFVSEVEAETRRVLGEIGRAADALTAALIEGAFKTSRRCK